MATLTDTTEITELQIANATLEVLKNALLEAEKHLPTKADRSWITCSCGNAVRSYYWTRHTTGADGSGNATRVLETLGILS